MNKRVEQKLLEIKLLQETIGALRDELEKTHHEKREHTQLAVADANNEIHQLRAGLVELRDQLELREAQHEQNVQNLRLQQQHELAELHQTIATLRETIEELNESSKKASSSRETKTTAATPH